MIQKITKFNVFSTTLALFTFPIVLGHQEKWGTKNLSTIHERQRFESLLASGRTLAFPFSTGWILSLVQSQTLQSERWNVSVEGLHEIVGIPSKDFLSCYQESANLVRKDSNTKISSSIYVLRNSSKIGPVMDVSGVDSVKHLVWDDDKADSIRTEMNKDLNQNTNSLLDGKLYPKQSLLGDPFKPSTQAVLVNTFYYNNSWQIQWEMGGQGTFGNNGDNVAFWKVEGKFQHSNGEDYSAVSVPLEESEKSIVFILPKVNLTTFLKLHQNTFTRIRNEEDVADFVPFPVKWEKRNLTVSIPSFTLSYTDQYGKELEGVKDSDFHIDMVYQLGMNETFCTTIHDKSGRIPYYMRPIVQVNFVNVTNNFVEIASATGTAIEKFGLGLDFAGIGYPRKDSIFRQRTGESTEGNNEDSYMLSESSSAMKFNKPFLWYLNDERLGPLFYGIVEKTDSSESQQMWEVDSTVTEDTLRFLMWSCRSFKQEK